MELRSASIEADFKMIRIDPQDPSIVMFESLDFPGQYLTNWDIYEEPIICSCFSQPTSMHWILETAERGTLCMCV